MEYTLGFSPHPKTVFGPPLPMGVTGKSEPAEFWFQEWVGEFLPKWKDSMPEGFEITRADEVSGVSLTKLCVAASYIIKPINAARTEDIARAIESEFTGLGSLLGIHADDGAIAVSVTDLERSGASRMVKSLVTASLISGWRDMVIERTAVGRWDEGRLEVIPLSEEI
jgi:hypothetical protein